ncbi:hypothetical protein [Rhodobacteraceae bacterium DSL-40]|uniref:hypothetical protein n=1 Tax=Amaricoccus sp. B4 TaxID=3368557 RepID=UPI0013A6C036
MTHRLQIPPSTGLTFSHGILVTVAPGGIFDRHPASLLALNLLDMIFIANLISTARGRGNNTYDAAHFEKTAGGPNSEHDGSGAVKPRIPATIVIIAAFHLLHEILGKNFGA